VDKSLTVTAVHEVAYGREDDFYAWAASWLREAEKSDDFLGGGILGPSVAGGEWHVIYRWVDQESAQWWEDAATRAGWMDLAESFAQPVQVQQITGLRPWFEKRAQAASPPPKWKMALVTLTAVFPPVLLFNLTVIPRMLGLPVILRTLVLCVGVTVIVTWVMMPRLMRLLKDWLHPPAPQQSPSARLRAPAIGVARPGGMARAGGVARAGGDTERRVLTPVPAGRHAAPGDPYGRADRTPRYDPAPHRREAPIGPPDRARPQWNDPPDDRPSRPPLSPVPADRRVLHLLRDGRSPPSSSRLPPHRDDRSSYLRREIG
jgi:antibiotic biosynthesis monooxygenase (ABM) superfamily enzyme